MAAEMRLPEQVSLLHCVKLSKVISTVIFFLYEDMPVLVPPFVIGCSAVMPVQCCKWN